MEEKTTLQRIVEQKTEQICNAIEQAIDDDATLKLLCSDEVEIDGVRIYSNSNGTNSIVLHLNSEKIARTFKPSKKDLEILANIKRLELEEIEKQIKSNLV